VASGEDFSGKFGGFGQDLAGKYFTMTSIFDTSFGTLETLDLGTRYLWGLHGNNPMRSTVFNIGGRSYTFDDSDDGNLLWRSGSTSFLEIAVGQNDGVSRVQFFEGASNITEDLGYNLPRYGNYNISPYTLYGGVNVLLIDGYYYGDQGEYFVPMTEIHFSNQMLSIAPVPESCSWTMMVTGFGLMGAVMRYRRRPSVSFA